MSLKTDMKIYSLNGVGNLVGISGAAILGMAKIGKIPFPKQLIGSKVYFYSEEDLPEIYNARMRYEIQEKEKTIKKLMDSKSIKSKMDVNKLKNKISSLEEELRIRKEVNLAEIAERIRKLEIKKEIKLAENRDKIINRTKLILSKN